MKIKTKSQKTIRYKDLSNLLKLNLELNTNAKIITNKQTIHQNNWSL